MDTIIYLTLEEVLIIHEDQIERYGGSSGLRDITLLESAVYRPQTLFAGRDLYISHFEKAAALLHSLVMNHAFIDGNKRTGTASILVFLESNGVHVSIRNRELAKAVLCIVNEKWSINTIVAWLKNITA